MADFLDDLRIGVKPTVIVQPMAEENPAPMAPTQPGGDIVKEGLNALIPILTKLFTG